MLFIGHGLGSLGRAVRDAVTVAESIINRRDRDALDAESRKAELEEAECEARLARREERADKKRLHRTIDSVINKQRD